MALLVGAALVGAIPIALFLAAMPPATRASLPDDATARGEAFEQALVAALTKIRPAGEEWAIAIDPADLNAWLATRLPQWIAHDPELAALAPATTLRVAALEGALIIEDSARASADAVVSLPVTPSLVGGRLHLDIGLARIGRLPVPLAGSALATLLRESLDRLAAGPAEIPLADRRRVELRALSCEPRRITLLFATRPAASP
jgi:hypothetical protein